MNICRMKGEEHRYLYVDNFYTRNLISQKLYKLSGGEIFTTGTVRYIFVGHKDKENLLSCIKN